MGLESVDGLEKRLGQILVDNDKISKTDLEYSIAAQEKNVPHKLLGGILIELNLISKDDLIFALNKQLEYSDNETMSKPVSSDEDAIKQIADKYKETEYSNDLYELINIITHKMRNPLAGISAATEVLKEKTVTNDTNEKFFAMIFKEIDRLETVMKDLYKTFSNK